ncbi:MAG: phosphate signaling complex protein PhoU [candidate division Zixibacteria bacterium]|nr:phosphate signaling complex protein PhoU [candidate division Zixibacteria bacterium]
MTPERHFHEELAEVNDMLLGMSSLVLEIFDDAVESVLTDNAEQAQKVIDERGRVDSLEVAIEERCLALIALHQPVAVDLRMIITAINIIRDLERIDDISIDICQDALGLHELKNKPDTLFDLPSLARVSGAMVHDAVRAFVKKDPAWARRVCERDDEADDLERKIHDDVIAYAEKHPAEVAACVHLLAVARALERIADHSTNVGEMVVYLMTAKIIKHHHDVETEGGPGP